MVRRALALAWQWTYDAVVSSTSVNVEIGDVKITETGPQVGVQTVHLRAKHADKELELLLVNAPERMRDNDSLHAIHELLAGRYPGVLLTFYKRYGRGHATVVHTGRASALAVAAAVAAWSYSGGWDENDPIVVTVNNQRLACSVDYADERWDVTVSEITE